MADYLIKVDINIPILFMKSSITQSTYSCYVYKNMDLDLSLSLWFCEVLLQLLKMNGSKNPDFNPIISTSKMTNVLKAS